MSNTYTIRQYYNKNFTNPFKYPRLPIVCYKTIAYQDFAAESFTCIEQFTELKTSLISFSLFISSFLSNSLVVISIYKSENAFLMDKLVISEFAQFSSEFNIYFHVIPYATVVFDIKFEL